MPSHGETRDIYSEPLTIEQVRAIRDAYNAQNDYIEVACTFVGGVAGAAVAGALGAGLVAAVGNAVSNMLQTDTQHFDDLVLDLINGEYRSLKSVTTMKYRNSGKNSGWYVDSVDVIGVK